MEKNTERQTLNNKDLLRMVFFFCSKNGKFTSSTRLQKLVFLAQNKLTEYPALKSERIYADEAFKFEADNFGPFSADLVKLVKELEANKEIEMNLNSNPAQYTITTKLKKELAKKVPTLKEHDIVKSWIVKIKNYGKFPLDQLLRVVYQDPIFQKYLTASRIKNRY